MLKLIGIKKDYLTAGATVQALKGVDLRFRKNEFVSVLGASGCGKTTLLNIIGGLDHYTDGDLVINGKSTKTYNDHDWDVYRNHRIGFVFQSYNLIPQQTVLGNVEIALTIAGVSKAERKSRAEEALRRVGLEKEMKKRPNQLSGGQMQRVAIARALVNNPEILLADEPTGALDTETSVQIMDLIREIAGERLVIMVTHNPELAAEYSNRIVRLQDGLVIADSNPYDMDIEEVEEENQAPTSALNEEKVEEPEVKTVATVDEQGKKKKRAKKEKESSSMSFKTSLELSAKNLAMKKGRTIVTSIAGSIGIISVCLVLALSNGFNNYIKKTQEDMLSSQPLTISETTLDVNAIMSGMSSATDLPDLSQIGDNVYVNSFLTNIAQGMTVTNDLSDEYLNYVGSMDEDWYEAISYSTGMKLENSLYTSVEIEGESGQTEQTVMSLSELKAYYTLKLTQQEEKYASLAYLVDYLGSVYGKMPGTEDASSDEFGSYVLSQYDVLSGRFPNAANEAVLVIGGNNDMTDLTLAQLGFIGEKEFLSLFPQAGNEDSKPKELMIPFDKIVNKSLSFYYNDAIYTQAEPTAEYVYEYAGRRSDLNVDDGTGMRVTITGVLRLKEDLNYGCLGNGGLYLTEQACNQLLEKNMQSKLAQTLVIQGQKVQQFSLLSQQLKELDPTSSEYVNKQQELGTLFTEAAANGYFKCAASTLTEYYMSADAMSEGGGSGIPEGYSFIYGDAALRHVGGKNTVNNVEIYTDTFESKELILNYLDEWNDTHEEAKQVKYTDTIGMMMSMVEMMLNAITVVLVAFTAISLVVSSVMIGIITYVSVVERVKEIGVLRSLGARKRDIKNLFNAETFIIGLSSGVFGVVVTYILSLGINALLGALTGIATLAALPITSALVMILISVGLTLISGLIPAGAAAKKDPVVALRTE